MNTESSNDLAGRSAGGAPLHDAPLAHLRIPMRTLLTAIGASDCWTGVAPHPATVGTRAKPRNDGH